jgi:hypothetical protein
MYGRRTVIGALAALGLVLGASAGCGRADDQTETVGGQDVATVLASAGRKSQRAETVIMDISITATGGGEEQAFDITGSADFAKKSMDMTMRIPGAGVVNERIVDGVMYLKMPGGMGDLGGKPWVRLDMDRLAKTPVGQSYQGFMSNQGTDPDDMLASLRATANVKKVGSETIDGVRTTEYQADLDPAKVKGLDARTRRSLEARLATAGVSMRPIHVWLRHDGLVRRMQLTMTIGSGGTSGTSKITWNFHDWGTPVKVDAPPAGDTAELTDRLLARLGGS